ncbi:MAG: substrate-binding domain-containing protein [Chloroflexota bacterium]
MLRASTHRLVAGFAAIAVLTAACTSGGGASPAASTAASAAAPSTAASEAAPSTGASAAGAASPGGSAAAGGKQWKIGFSNAAGVGNGFREEQLCTARAQALVSGQVSELTAIHHTVSATEQLQDLRDLIAKKVDAIVFNPNDAAALNPALAEAHTAGIKTVAIDAYVTDPNTVNLSNDQVGYAYVGASWLFKQMGGQGTVYYMRGLAGHPADNDRHTGFMKALSENPNIKVLPSKDGIATGWDPNKGTQLINEFIASGQYDTIQGIWTSGIDQQVVDAIQKAGKKFVPIVGADLRGFVDQLLNTSGKYNGLQGIAVYNPAAVGGAGILLALKLLNGETVQMGEGNKVLLPTPEAYDNVSDAGKAKLKEVDVPQLNALWPVSYSIPNQTTYTLDQMLACKGPGQ